jgi:hypothetical protein
VGWEIRDVPVLLPDAVIETLRQLINDGDNHQFRVGDFICDVLDEFPAIARADLIKQMADRTGANRSTLRDRHNMARFFPSKVRQEFDMLTFSQLRACKSAGEEWRTYAEWAAENMPAPVAVIRARIKNNGDDQPAWVHRWESMQGIAKMLENDSEAPEKVRKIARLVARQDEGRGWRGGT